MDRIVTPNTVGTSAPASPGTRYQQLLAEHIGDMNPGLERRVSELLALTDFSAEAFERLSTSEVGSLIVLVALGESGARWAGLLLPDDEGVLRPESRRGAGSAGWDELQLEGPERLPAALVLRSGGEHPEEDAAAEPFRQLMRDCEASSATLLRTRDGLRGVLLLGEPHPDLAGSQTDFLEALSVSAAAALEKCRRDEELRVANRRLSLHVYQLRSLMDLTAGLHRARDEAAVWDLLLHGAMGHVLASRAAVVAGGRVVAAKGPRRPDDDGAVFCARRRDPGGRAQHSSDDRSLALGHLLRPRQDGDRLGRALRLRRGSGNAFPGSRRIRPGAVVGGSGLPDLAHRTGFGRGGEPAPHPRLHSEGEGTRR